MSGTAQTHIEEFESRRGLLFAVAYRMLGTVADAEDVVQDAWLRWSAGDRSGVRDPEAFLVRIATNLAVDRLTSARARRETYVGPWLPEPVLTSRDVAEDVELAESVSMAMLVVLETLSPLERAVFVLREVFGHPYADIARMLGRTPESVRQLGTRARKHVEARRPRFAADASRRRDATERFLAATMGGDLEELLEVVAPDVELWTDGGGNRRAALRVIRGADKVARFAAALTNRPYAGYEIGEMTMRPAMVNSRDGVLVSARDGTLLAALTAEVDVDGRIAAIHLVANPEKLTALEAGTHLPA